jgi:hypothetical protein
VHLVCWTAVLCLSVVTAAGVCCCRVAARAVFSIHVRGVRVLGVRHLVDV